MKQSVSQPKEMIAARKVVEAAEAYNREQGHENDRTWSCFDVSTSRLTENVIADTMMEKHQRERLLMSSAHSSSRRLAPHTTSNDERRLRLVESAYSLIAEKGMAGLRIREVASRVGLNHATLLYYFPTKEALIQAVVEYCIRQFELIQAPNPSVVTTPREHLRQRYLSDLAYQLREVPELFLVLDEFLLYAVYDKDSFLGQPFALLKPHIHF